MWRDDQPISEPRRTSGGEDPGIRQDRGVPRLVPLPRVDDDRGSLSFIEAGDDVPFQIRRVYYVTGVPAGAQRGGHAHANNERLIVAVAGSVRITVDNGIIRVTYALDRSDLGLYIPSLTWCELHDFSATAVCLVLSSQHYDASDYISDYDEFVSKVRRCR